MLRSLPLLCLLGAPLAAPLGAPSSGDVIRVTDTTPWGSSDPAGLTYLPAADRLLMTDSEIEETIFFTGSSAFQVERDGTLDFGFDLTVVTNEPTGVVHHAGTGTLFVSDDNFQRIWEVSVVGTTASVVSHFSTAAFGCLDPEGITYVPETGNLFITDGMGLAVFEVTTSGTLVSSFAAPPIVLDGEGIAYDPGRGTLFISSSPNKRIVEVTTDGQLVSVRDLSWMPGVYGVLLFKGIVMAPSSEPNDDPTNQSMFLADYGWDELNDGRLFELTFEDVPALEPVSNLSVAADDTLVAGFSASDPDGDSLSYSESGLPPFAALVDNLDGTATLTLDPLSGDEGTYPVTVSVTDDSAAALSDSVQFDIIVSASQTPPLVIAAGEDNWASPPPSAAGLGGTIIDFAQSPLPADFFFPGSAPFSGSVVLRGAPLTTSPIGALGQADTIVRRTASSAPLALGDSDVVPLELIALSLESCRPIQVDGGAAPQAWSVRASLSQNAAQAGGSMTLTRTHPDGGSFALQLDATTRLVFTRDDVPAQTSVLDPAPALALDRAAGPFAVVGGLAGLDRALLQIDGAPAGVGVDGDGDGVLEATTVGGSNLLAGVGFDGCNFRCVTSPATSLAHAWSVSGDADGDGYANGCDNCPSTFQTNQLETDGDGFGDACDAIDGGLHFNEIYIRQDGADFDEFIELVGPPAASLDEHLVVLVGGTPGATLGVLLRAYDLTGLSIPLDGYFVLGGSAVPERDLDIGGPNELENGPSAFLLVRTSGAAQRTALTGLVGQSLDDDGDGVTALQCFVAEVLESVALTDGNPSTQVALHAPANTLGPVGPGTPPGVFRGGDFPGAWCGAFLDADAQANLAEPRTPGAPNGACPTPRDSCDCRQIGVPLAICTPNVNSTGSTAHIRAEGSLTAADQDLRLVVESLPSGVFGFFFASMTPGFVPNPGGSNGNLCVGGAIGRYSKPGQVGQGPTFFLDIGTLLVPTAPVPGEPLLAGQTWYFQAWYRDAAAGGGENNFSDAVCLQFN